MYTVTGIRITSKEGMMEAPRKLDNKCEKMYYAFKNTDGKNTISYRFLFTQIA
jgi:hypothetical protein